MSDATSHLGRLSDHDRILPIIELYPAIQAEGSRAGHPTIIIRTTGCTHRCHFAEGGWCDTWYSSIHPEKGRYTFNAIKQMYADKPHIREMMITGGSPTMHPVLINELTHFARQQQLYVTLETEGSHYVETDYPIDLISISPKLANSVPDVGLITPQGAVVDQRMIKQHHRYRMNQTAMAALMAYHTDYQIKPVLDAELSVVAELEALLQALQIPDEKVWLMPAGDNREALSRSYGPVMNCARDRGWRFTSRPQIMAFDTERGV